MARRIEDLRAQMFLAAENLDFERAAALRDQLKNLRALDVASSDTSQPPPKTPQKRPRRPAASRSRR